MEAIRSLPSSSQSSSREASPERTIHKESVGCGNGKVEGGHEEGEQTPRAGKAVGDPPAGPSSMLEPSAPIAGVSHAVPSLEELLCHPVEFVPFHEESTSLGVESKYTPINSPASDATVVSTTSSSTLVNVPAEYNEVEPSDTINVRPLLLSWGRIEFAPQPLANLGNTCFLNSALQALLWCPPLVQALRREPLYEECPHIVKKGKHPFCALCTMIRVVRRVHGPPRAKLQQRSWAPHDLVSNITRIMPIREYDVGLQQDAHEFLIFLRERLSSACASLLPPPSEAKNAPPRPPTLIDRLFNVKTRSRVKCERCGHCSDSLSDDMDLGLDIRRCPDIRDALHALSAVEIMKGANAYHCEKCNLKVTAEKSFALLSAPPVLTIFLKRFTAFSKLKHLVHYPYILDLKPYLAQDCPPQVSTVYRLFSVLLHHGEGTHSGHYHTLVQVPMRTRNNTVRPEWFDCNDDFIRENVNPMDRKEAYLLFYVRDDNLRKGLPIQKNLPARPPVLQELRQAQQRAAGVTVKNTNGKRVLMSDGEDEEEGEKESPKRAKLDEPIKLSLVVEKPPLEEGEVEDVGAPVLSTPSSPLKSPDTITPKWRKAAMELVSEDIGVPLREISVSPGKNANGKRPSSEADAEGAGASPKRQRLASLSLPPSSPIAPKTPQLSPINTGIPGLPPRPNVSYSGSSMAVSNGSRDGQKPKQGPAHSALPPTPSSPTGARKDQRSPLTPVRPSPLISPTLPSNPLGPRVADPVRRNSDMSNVTTPASSPEKENVTAQPSWAASQRPGWDDQVARPKPSVTKTYKRQSNGGRNPFSNALAGGGRRPKRRGLM